MKTSRHRRTAGEPLTQRETVTSDRRGGGRERLAIAG
jgi:hypothetical protein